VVFRNIDLAVKPERAVHRGRVSRAVEMDAVVAARAAPRLCDVSVVVAPGAAGVSKPEIRGFFIGSRLDRTIPLARRGYVAQARVQCVQCVEGALGVHGQ